MSFDVSLSRPNIATISQFVSLVTATSAPIAPPVAILGLSYIFLNWLSNNVLENMCVPPICMIWYLLQTPRSDVQRLLIAYIVDLINGLRELFDFTVKPASALLPTWKELSEAFEAYERSFSRQRIHNSICSGAQQGEQILTADGLDEKVRALVRGWLGNGDRCRIQCWCSFPHDLR